MVQTRAAAPCLGSAAWGFRELELSQQLAMARRNGMACHELGIANADTDLPLDATEQQLEEVKALYSRSGIGLTCAATGNDFTGADYQEQTDKVLRVIDICAALGVEKLRIFAGFTAAADMTHERWENLRASVATVAAAARRKGVTLCVETHGGVEPLRDGVRHIRSATTQISDMQAVLAGAGSDVKIVFDPANLHAVGEDPVDFWHAMKDRVGYIHLKDFRRGPQGQLYPAALGEGGTPWEPIAEEMARSKVPILFEYEICGDIESGLQRCIASWNHKGE